MQAYTHIDPASLLDTLLSLSAAFVLGGLIGLERQVRQRTAGLRTNVLVCVGAALFVDIAVRFYELHGGGTSPLHVVAYVVSGVGFLGAGVIMREEGNVRGLNTAATLWGSAAVGSAAGADLMGEAVMGAVFVLAANTLLRPMVNRINRQPIDTDALEVTYSINLMTPADQREAALALLQQVFDSAGLPLRDVEVEPFGDDEVAITAMLVPTSVDGGELDRLVMVLQHAACVGQAYWRASTTE